jgi:acyl carrier protein
MNHDHATKIIFEVLAGIAPEVDPGTVDHGLDLTDQLDLDSMDYLNWMIGIGQAVDIDIPQRDTGEFMTIDGAAGYLVSHVG